MDVKISHQPLSKQFINQMKVLALLFQNMEKIYGLLYGYKVTSQNTFQNNTCFTIFGQVHNGESKKTKTNRNATKNPNSSKNSNP